MILGQYWKTVIQKTMKVVGNTLFACPNREIPSFFLIDTCVSVNYAPTVCGIKPITALFVGPHFVHSCKLEPCARFRDHLRKWEGWLQRLVWLAWQPVQPRRALTQQSQQYINHRSLSLMSFSSGTLYLVLLSNSSQYNS
jgi:hypothetical protein